MKSQFPVALRYRALASEVRQGLDQGVVGHALQGWVECEALAGPLFVQGHPVVGDARARAQGFGLDGVAARVVEAAQPDVDDAGVLVQQVEGAFDEAARTNSQSSSQWKT